MVVKNDRYRSILLYLYLWTSSHFAQIFVLFLWISTNITLFIVQFLYYHRSKSFFYLRAIVSDGLSVSRAAALCLNFNCALILLPVCRNMLALLRFLFPQCLIVTSVRRWFMRLADHHIEFHRCVGYAICFWSLVHVAGHIRNYESLVHSHNEYQSLVGVLNRLYLSLSPIQVNPINKIDANILGVQVMVETIPGVTGVILVVCLFMIFSSSAALIRRSFFEIFWVVHQLFIVFFICLMIHGSQGVIRRQINLHEHDPNICASLYREWGRMNQCLKYPQFQGLSPTSWQWLCGPLTLYLCERILRFIRSLQKVEILDVIRHRSNVIEIRFRKPSMNIPQPGQYIYLKFYSMAKFEWHPFTVTSAPEEPFVSVHIRIVGNWTRELSERFKDFPNNIPRLSVDGPYGSAADDVFSYDSAILIGAGIGVTPYTAILKHIRLSDRKSTQLRRIYFYWICNTTACYEWFGDMLKEVERELHDRNIVLILRIYLTQWSINDALDIWRHREDELDMHTGLQTKTFYGRPNFDLNFQAIVKENLQAQDKQSIGVFVCAPVQLVNQLRGLCMRMNDRYVSKGKVRFYLNKEKF